jgi:hypothetical protein
MLDDAHLHRSKGPTPRTTGTEDCHHATNLVDHFITVPGPPPALPSSEVGPLGSGTPPDLRSPCGNRLLRRFMGHETRRSGQAGERIEEEGERRRGTWTSGEGSTPKEVTRWKNKRRRAGSGGCEPPLPTRQVARVDRWGGVMAATGVV